MNKPFASAVVIAAMLALLGGCHEEKQPQKPQPQFGVVQLTKLYQDSRIGKAGFERLSGLENKAKEELTPFIEKLEKAHADKSDDAERLERELQEKVTFMQDVMRREQEHVTNVLQTELITSMGTVLSHTVTSFLSDYFSRMTVTLARRSISALIFAAAAAGLMSSC